LALTIAQILFWMALIGVPVGLVLQAQHSRAHGELPDSGARPKAKDTTRHSAPSGVASDTSRTRFARPDGRENAMVDINSGLAEAIKDVVEDVKGKAKVIIGALTGRDDLFNEGKAQQDKAQAQRNAAKKEAEAESARTAAKVAEKRQKAEQ
jgi:uncharacterized protein YjbJ (UPF0337 family)